MRQDSSRKHDRGRSAAAWERKRDNTHAYIGSNAPSDEEVPSEWQGQRQHLYLEREVRDLRAVTEALAARLEQAERRNDPPPRPRSERCRCHGCHRRANIEDGHVTCCSKCPDRGHTHACKRRQISAGWM